MASEHTHKTTSWVTVGIIVLASVLLGLALPLESLALGVVGGVLLLVGVVMAFTYKLMDDAH